MKSTGQTILVILFLITGISPASGQDKVPLDHSVYDDWKSLNREAISDDGSYITYEINPQEGDGYLYLYDIESKQLDSIARGFNATISAQSDFFTYLVKPTFAETRQAKKDKKKNDQMPKNDLGIKVLPDGQWVTVERVKSYKVPDKGGAWMAYLMEKPLPEKKDSRARTVPD